MIEFNLAAICEMQRRLDYHDKRDRKGRFAPENGAGREASLSKSKKPTSAQKRIQRRKVECSGKQAEEMLNAKIESGEFPMTLRSTDQNKHIQGTVKYKNAVEKGEYPSYTHNTYNELQDIIKRCKGPVLVKNGGFLRQGQDPAFKGFAVNRKTGKAVRTTKFTIHYSPRGTHTVPRK